MTFEYHHNSRTFTAEIHRIGPAIQVVAFEGEFYASLAIGWMHSGDSGAVITKWEVDGQRNASNSPEPTPIGIATGEPSL